jgi:hypothetical protein
LAGNPIQNLSSVEASWVTNEFLVGGLEPWNFMTFHSVGNTIIPFDELIFFRGVGLNHQPGFLIFPSGVITFQSQTLTAQMTSSLLRIHYFDSKKLVMQLIQGSPDKQRKLAEK